MKELWEKSKFIEFIDNWCIKELELNSLYGNNKLSLSSSKDQHKIKYINNCLVEEISEYMYAKDSNHRLDELADVLNFSSWLVIATGLDISKVKNILFNNKTKFSYTLVGLDYYSFIGSTIMLGMMAMNVLQNRGWVENETETDENLFYSRIEEYIACILFFIACQGYTDIEILEALTKKIETNKCRINNGY